MAVAEEKRLRPTKTNSLVTYASLVCADMVMAFLWVFLNAFARVAVDLGFASMDMAGRQFLKKGLVIALLFLFYWLSKLSNGATYNPLTVIAYAAAGITHYPLLILSLRVPAQVIGAMVGPFVAVLCLPEVYRPMLKGPYLRVDPHIGAVAEGMLTFSVVFVALIASLKGPRSGIQRTWITSISRVSLSTLGAAYTGPAMNPANAFGWAFLKNEHNTWEHVCVLDYSTIRDASCSMGSSSYAGLFKSQRKKKLILNCDGVGDKQHA